MGEHVLKGKKVNNQMSISMKEKVSYGLGDLASNFIFGFVGMFLVFYYTDVAKLDAGIIGTVILFSRIFDGFTDVFMGFIVDKTKSKYGKARPWLLWMAIPFALSAILLFTIPDGAVISIVYVVITYNLVNLIYTAINVPYGVLNSLITQDQDERSVLNITRMIGSMTGTLIVSMVTIPLVNALGGDKIAWLLTIGSLSIIGCILFFITFSNTRERVEPVSEEADSRKIPIGLSVKVLFKNKYWLMLLFVTLLTFIGQGLANGVTVYFAQNILNDEGLVGVIMMTTILPVLIALFFMAPFIKRYGKRNVALFGLSIVLLGCFIMTIQPESITIVLIGNTLKGLGTAPLMGTVFAMIADTIEYGEWKTGVRNEGMVYSAAGFGAKAGMGLGAAILGWMLSISNYSGGLEMQPDSAHSAIILMFVYIPIIITIIQMIILWFYKLDKEYINIIEDLQETN